MPSFLDKPVPAVGRGALGRYRPSLPVAGHDRRTKAMVKPSLARNAPLGAALVLSALALGASPARADGNLQNVNHIIIVMQENHSFDNYFGVLAYVPNTPYHSAKGSGRRRRSEERRVG